MQNIHEVISEISRLNQTAASVMEECTVVANWLVENGFVYDINENLHPNLPKLQQLNLTPEDRKLLDDFVDGMSMLNTTH